MRTITSKSTAAFKNCRNFRLSNTEVEKDGNWMYFYLHGNCIAAFNPTEKKLKVTAAGWYSNTTKDRLNGILKTFELGSIFQKNRSWFYSSKDGQVEPMKKVLEFSL